MALRQYQQDSVNAVWRCLRDHPKSNPAVVLPTGSGKTHVIAEICRQAVEQWNGRVLVVAHVKELVEQAASKLRATAPDLPIGVYSAGLGRRDLGYAVTVAGIQSVYQRGYELGRIDLVIVDEAHMIPPGRSKENGDGMYRQLIADIGQVTPHRRVLGLTATPYRMKDGAICGPDNILTEVCIEVGVRELIAGGYLCPLRSRAGSAIADLDGVKVRAGEFAAGDLEARMTDGDLVRAACADIIRHTADRSSTLIFASGVDHGEQIVATLANEHETECGFVTGETPANERDRIIDRFKSGDLAYLANVNVLTTGFDAPNVDCVAMLRPTMSPGLYYQMVGRGFRIHPDKADCLVLDYGENVIRHGPVDAIRVGEKGKGDGSPPAKQCPDCDALIATGYAVCPECGHVFPARELKHGNAASEASILSGGEKGPERSTKSVTGTKYYVHHKQGNMDATPTMRVEYDCGFYRKHKEWVCIEHEGFAARKAREWWTRRSHAPFPESVEQAVDLARAGALAETGEIVVETKPGDTFERIVGHDLGEKPDANEYEDGLGRKDGEGGYYCGPSFIEESEIPF